jgi:hypothetical protein
MEPCLSKAVYFGWHLKLLKIVNMAENQISGVLDVQYYK